jgi:hypothetical protein
MYLLVRGATGPERSPVGERRDSRRTLGSHGHRGSVQLELWSFEKLGVTTRAEAVMAAIRRGELAV